MISSATVLSATLSRRPQRILYQIQEARLKNSRTKILRLWPASSLTLRASGSRFSYCTTSQQKGSARTHGMRCYKSSKIWQRISRSICSQPWACECGIYLCLGPLSLEHPQHGPISGVRVLKRRPSNPGTQNQPASLVMNQAIRGLSWYSRGAQKLQRCGLHIGDTCWIPKGTSLPAFVNWNVLRIASLKRIKTSLAELVLLLAAKDGDRKFKLEPPS